MLLIYVSKTRHDSHKAHDSVIYNLQNLTRVFAGWYPPSMPIYLADALSLINTLAITRTVLARSRLGSSSSRRTATPNQPALFLSKIACWLVQRAPKASWYTRWTSAVVFSTRKRFYKNAAWPDTCRWLPLESAVVVVLKRRASATVKRVGVAAAVLDYLV